MRFPRTAALAAVAVLAPVAGGCWVLRPDVAFNPDNPFHQIRVVAVAPVFDMTIDRDLLDTDDGYSPVQLGELLSSEMIQFAEFQVIRSTVVAAALEQHSGPPPEGEEGPRLPPGGNPSRRGWHPNDPDGPAIARLVMDALGADAILVCAITDFDPYGDPMVAVAAQFFASARAGSRGPDVGDLIQAGRPFPSDAGRRQGLIIGFEQMYDAKQRWVQMELGAYANYRNGLEERGLDPDKVYSWDAENYFRFAFNRTIHEVVRRGEILQEAWDHGVED